MRRSRVTLRSRERLGMLRPALTSASLTASTVVTAWRGRKTVRARIRMRRTRRMTAVRVRERQRRRR